MGTMGQTAKARRQHCYDLSALGFTDESIADALGMKTSTVRFLRQSLRLQYTGGPRLPAETLLMLRVLAPEEFSTVCIDDIVAYAIRRAESFCASDVESIVIDQILPAWIEGEIDRQPFIAAAKATIGGQSQ